MPAELDQSRLLTAEVNWGGNSDAIFWAGSAPIHQFWPRLAPQFSAALLAPQRRMDGEVVAWTWRQSDREDEITAAELLVLRALLGTSLESFRKAQPNHQEPGFDGAPAKGRTNLELLWDAVSAMVADLLAKSDRDLLTFAVRTEAGLRLHSWGAKKAASALAPEQLGHEVSGIVIAAGKAAADVEVLMKTGLGEIQAKTVSDGTGRFRFSNIGPGTYRVFALQGGTPFPNEGVEAAVQAQAVTGLKLRIGFSAETADPAPTTVETPAAPSRRRAMLIGLLGVLGLAGALLYWRQADAGKPVAVRSEAGEASAGSPRGASPAPERRSTTISTVAKIATNPHGGMAQARSSNSATAATSAASTPSLTSPGSPRHSTIQSPAASGSAASTSGAIAGPAGAGHRSLSTSNAAPAAPTARRPAPASSTSPLPNSPKRSENAPNSSSPSGSSLAGDNPAKGIDAPSRLNPAWAHRNQMSAGVWKVRLLVDPILPTDPTSDPSPESVEALRKRVIADQLAAMPSAFRSVQGRRGYSVQLPSGYSLTTYCWQLPPGADREVTTSVTPSRSELSWAGRPFPPPGVYTLTADRGQPMLRLEIPQSGAITVSRMAGVHASYWLAISASDSDPGTAGRFSWQRASGGALPSSWKGPGINRIDIPLSDSVGTEISSDLAYFDSATGWAATAQVQFRSVPSLGSQ